MTSRIRFDPTDAIIISGVYFLIWEQTSGGLILQQMDNAKVLREYTHAEVHDLLRSPDTRLKRGYFKGHKTFTRLRTGKNYLSTLPEKTRSRIVWKGIVCRVFLEAEREGLIKRCETSITEAMPVLRQRVDELSIQSQLQHGATQGGSTVTVWKMPCPRSMLGWVRAFETSEGCLLSLARKKRSDDTYKRKFSREAVKLLNECLWEFMSDQRPTVAKIIRDTRDRFNDINEERLQNGLPAHFIPSASELERRIRRFHRFSTKVARHGRDAAQRDMAIYEHGMKICHPLQRVEMDEWKIDVFSLLSNAGFFDGLSAQDTRQYDVGRRWLYLAIDVATRCVVGFKLAKTQSSADALNTVSMIAMDKTPLARAAGCESDWPFYGGCGSLSTDMGPAFAADVYRIAVSDIGFNPVAPVAGVPNLRGHIERVFGTFATQLMPELTGRSFSNTQERGDHPGNKRAALTDEDLAQVFTRFIVDIYHNVPHEGLKGETPANAWKRLAHAQGVTPPPDATAMRSVFGIPIHRKIGRHGVRVFGIHYLSPEIESAYLDGQHEKLEVRIDPHDLTHVSACLSGEWHSAKAVSDAVWGLSLEEWQEIVRKLRHKHKQEAELQEDVVRRARKAIRKTNSDAMKLRRLSPLTCTTKDLERAERDLFMALTIKPKSAEAPIKDAPVGKGLLGDVIAPTPEADEQSEPHIDSKPSKKWGFRHD